MGKAYLKGLICCAFGCEIYGRYAKLFELSNVLVSQNVQGRDEEKYPFLDEEQCSPKS